ncbi:hypothetical protein BGW80DRAFT_1270889, partial [Lactifluus volemus]
RWRDQAGYFVPSSTAVMPSTPSPSLVPPKSSSSSPPRSSPSSSHNAQTTTVLNPTSVFKSTSTSTTSQKTVPVMTTPTTSTVTSSTTTKTTTSKLAITSTLTSTTSQQPRPVMTTLTSIYTSLITTTATNGQLTTVTTTCYSTTLIYPTVVPSRTTSASRSRIGMIAGAAAGGTALFILFLLLGAFIASESANRTSLLRRFRSYLTPVSLTASGIAIPYTEPQASGSSESRGVPHAAQAHLLGTNLLDGNDMGTSESGSHSHYDSHSPYYGPSSSSGNLAMFTSTTAIPMPCPFSVREDTTRPMDVIELRTPTPRRSNADPESRIQYMDGLSLHPENL